MNTTANKITIFRIILIPVFMVLAYQNLFGWALAVYIIACLSDVADGYIARHYNQVSNFGKFMDPLADKMLVLAAMCIFIERGQMPAWCVAIVLFREFAVSGLRLLAVEQGRVIAAAISGKLKTGCTMVGLGTMLVFGQYPAVNIVCTAIIVITTLYSGLSILTIIGLIICLVADEITKVKIDKYMASCGFKKEIDHIYHLNNGDKVFYKFTRPYYDGDGNIAMQTVKAEVVYSISYKQVKHTYSNRVPHLPIKITYGKD